MESLSVLVKQGFQELSGISETSKANVWNVRTVIYILRGCNGFFTSSCVLLYFVADIYSLINLLMKSLADWQKNLNAWISILF